ncbi:MAG: TolC family protein [Hymenobacter sp.]
MNVGGQRGRQLQAAKEPGELPQLRRPLLTQQDLCGGPGRQPGRAGHPAAGACRRSPSPSACNTRATPSAVLSQQLFDGGYLIGLKAAKVYQELSKKQTQQAEIDVVEQVSKAYYSTLVARSRLALLARNVQRLDTVLYQTNQTFKAGFAEKLDVDRLRVQRNNLVVEQQKAQRLTELSVALLKFQMGLPQSQTVQLTDSLGAAVVDAARPAPAPGGSQLRHRRRRYGGASALPAQPSTTAGTDNAAPAPPLA